MEFKVFMQTVEEKLARISSEEELRDWIRGYARSLSEGERETFLKKLGSRERKSHQDKLQEIIDWCEKVDEEEITLSCYGYESYEYGGWGSDWIMKYEDPYEIGRKLEACYEEAEQAVYDRDYQSASRIYWNLGILNIVAVDEDGGDPVDMSVEDMKKEGLADLDFGRICPLTLYAEYQADPLTERAAKMYGYFSWGMFRETFLKDMMEVGTEPLEGMEEFLLQWIAYLREQDDTYTARLLKEAVMLWRGDEGLLEEARRMADKQPALYIDLLGRFLEKEQWEQLKNEGLKALKLMDRKMEIRDQAARMTARGASHMQDNAACGHALTEAFYSKMAAANYLRVITCGSLEAGIGEEGSGFVPDRENILETAEKIYKEIQASRQGKEQNRYYWRSSRDRDPYIRTEGDCLGIAFLNGDYETVWKEAKKTTVSLGWSGRFIEAGVPMLLLYLFEGEEMEKGMAYMLGKVKYYLNYKEKYGEPDFAERFFVWKKTIDIPEEDKKKILKYLQKITDKRVEAIVSGQHRGSYGKAAALGAALGEAEEAMGITYGKTIRLRRYLDQFPRHRAFKSEINAFLK